MKYYKLTDGNFDGFYDNETHGDIVYGNDFHPLAESRWQELLDGQSEGGEIRILKNGELGLYQVPDLEEEMLKPNFNYETEEWEELATYEELLEHYETKLVEVQKEIKLREELGLRPSKEQLELKSKYMNRHIDICHEIALTLN